MVACKCEHTVVALQLIDFGAAVDIQDNAGVCSHRFSLFVR